MRQTSLSYLLTQTTRSGYGSSDVELTDTSESFGLPATADLMFALISTEELEELGQILVKQLKNRYNDLNMYKRFVVGIDSEDEISMIVNNQHRMIFSLIKMRSMNMRRNQRRPLRDLSSDVRTKQETRCRV